MRGTHWYNVRQQTQSLAGCKQPAKQHPPSNKLVLVETDSGQFLVCRRDPTGLYFAQNGSHCTVSDNSVVAYLVIQ